MSVIAELKRQGRDVVGLFCGEVREPEFRDELLKMATAGLMSAR